MDGHANPFSKQTNCFSSPSARGTESFLDRRKPPRKCRLKECPPGEIRYTLICLGEMAPTFEPSRKTLTLPLAGLRRWARPRTSWDAARTNDHGRKLGPNSTRGLATVGWSRQPRPLCPARCLRPWSRPHRIFHHRGSQFCFTPIGARRTVRPGLPESNVCQRDAQASRPDAIRHPGNNLGLVPTLRFTGHAVCPGPKTPPFESSFSLGVARSSDSDDDRSSAKHAAAQIDALRSSGGRAGQVQGVCQPALSPSSANMPDMPSGRSRRALHQAPGTCTLA
jgi:hypothetical protein